MFQTSSVRSYLWRGRRWERPPSSWNGRQSQGPPPTARSHLRLSWWRPPRRRASFPRCLCHWPDKHTQTRQTLSKKMAGALFLALWTGEEPLCCTRSPGFISGPRQCCQLSLADWFNWYLKTAPLFRFSASCPVWPLTTVKPRAGPGPHGMG